MRRIFDRLFAGTIAISFVTAFLFLALSPLNKPFANSLLLLPLKEVSVPPILDHTIRHGYKCDWENVYFKSRNGARLHGWYLKLPGATKTYLVSHGNTGNVGFVLGLAPGLLETGASVFLYDYQGFGASEGKASYETVIDDGIAAYDFLVAEEHVPKEQIVLFGQSFGCAVASQVMKERRVAGVVLQSGFSNVEEAARDKCPWMQLYPDWFFPETKLDNMTPYMTPHPALLIIHGKKDFILSVKYASRIYKAAIEPKQIKLLPNSNHWIFATDVPETLEALESFLGQL
jgi:Dipeptidyl aminopeptidases/acylaminoacyl-peptidases